MAGGSIFIPIRYAQVAVGAKLLVWVNGVWFHITVRDVVREVLFLSPQLGTKYRPSCLAFSEGTAQGRCHLEISMRRVVEIKPDNILW